MLSFIMATCDEGPALEASLAALGREMALGDRVIAIDTSAQDDTPARLAAFSESLNCDVIRLPTGPLKMAEVLALGLQMAQTPYVMLLGPQDRLNPAQLWRLRDALAAGPAWAVIDSLWGYGDPGQGRARVDAGRMAGCGAQMAASALAGLCPDPRRLILARDHWQPHGAVLGGMDTPIGLYAHFVGQGEPCAVVAAPIVLHHPTFTDPAPVLQALADRVLRAPQAVQIAALQDGMIWADDAVVRTAPDQAPALLNGLESLANRLPPGLAALLGTHDGPAGKLWRGHQSQGRQGAMLEFVQMVLAVEIWQNQILSGQVARLQKDLQRALPGPAYLRALYDRFCS